MSVQNLTDDRCESTCGDQSAALFSVTCTGSCDAGSIPAAGVRCIASQPTGKTPTYD